MTVVDFVLVRCETFQAGVAPGGVVAGEPFEDRLAGGGPVGVAVLVDELSCPSGAPGENSRHSRSGGLGRLRAGVVVRLGRRGRIPAMWWARIGQREEAPHSLRYMSPRLDLRNPQAVHNIVFPTEFRYRSTYMSYDLSNRMLSVREAAELLNLGRTAGYDAAHRYEATNGEDGMPVRRIGGRLRVPPREFAEKYGLDYPLRRSSRDVDLDESDPRGSRGSPTCRRTRRPRRP